MIKKEAIELLVNRDMQAVPREWVEIVAEKQGELSTLPMWGTMFIVDGNLIGEKLMKNSRLMYGTTDELQDEVSQGENSNFDERERELITKAIKKEDWSALEDYIDEEMQDARCILDKDGKTTAAYIYEIGNEYVIGVNGAGWDFYDGVWDKIYDVLGLKWHSED